MILEIDHSVSTTITTSTVNLDI